MKALTVISWDEVSTEVIQLNAHPDGTEYLEEEFPITDNYDKLCEYAKKIADEHELDDPDGPTFEPTIDGYTCTTATLELRSSRNHLATMTFIWF